MCVYYIQYTAQCDSVAAIWFTLSSQNGVRLHENCLTNFVFTLDIYFTCVSLSRYLSDRNSIKIEKQKEWNGERANVESGCEQIRVSVYKLQINNFFFCQNISIVIVIFDVAYFIRSMRLKYVRHTTIFFLM